MPTSYLACVAMTCKCQHSRTCDYIGPTVEVKIKLPFRLSSTVVVQSDE